LADLKLIADAVSETGFTFEWLAGGKATESLSSTALHSEIFTPSSSHLLRPDPAIVRRANLFLTLKFAEANIDDLLFDLDRHAELFSLAYQWVSDPANKDVLAELTHAINHALDGGGGGDGGGKQAGAGVPCWRGISGCLCLT